MTVDLKQPVGRELFLELCATADVLVEAFAPGTMARLGLDYMTVHERYPKLIYCSIPAWPAGMRYADLPGYEALVHARTGQQWEITTFRRGPTFLHSPVASFGAMLLVPTGIMAALLARDRTGSGQHVEVSLLQGVMALTTQVWNWTDRGQFLLAKTQPPGIHQESIFECAGGDWIHTSTMSGVTPTRSEASILGLEELSFQGLVAMSAEDRAAYRARKVAAYKSRDRAELVAELLDAGHAAEAIVAPHERFEHPQLRGTGTVVEVEDPEIGPTTQIGVTLFLERTPGAVKGGQPPPGAHTEEVLATLGHSQSEIAGLRAGGVV